MNKKAVTIVCTIGIILAVACIVYIFSNVKFDKPKEKEEPDEIEQEIVSREERSQNIILTSRIGIKLTDFIRYSNKYSSKLIDELDKDGISNKFKILTAFDKILSKEEYQNLVGYSQTYSNTYVLSSNMQTAINSLFEDKNYDKESIDGVLYYDNDTDSFAMITTGVQGYVDNFVVEVPYKITEYSNRVELEAYRLYISQSIQIVEEENTIVTDIYYDKEKTKNALSFTGNSEFYESNQINFLRENIDNKNIIESKMEKVKYTLIKEDNSYKFSKYEKMQ